MFIMEAGNAAKEFYSSVPSVFRRMEDREDGGLDAVSLSLLLRSCASRLYPDLAGLFSVSVPQPSLEALEEDLASAASRGLEDVGDITLHYAQVRP